MTRTGYKQITLQAEFYDEILLFVQSRDAHFPADASGGDLVRSLYRIAKREVRKPDSGRSEDSEPVRDGPDESRPLGENSQRESRQPEKTEHQPTERQKLESNLLAQKITLERQKQRTEWLKAVRQGKIQPQPRPILQSASPVGFLCKLHRTVHQDGPCREIREMAEELHLPVEQVGKGG